MATSWLRISISFDFFVLPMPYFQARGINLKPLYRFLTVWADRKNLPPPPRIELRCPKRGVVINSHQLLVAYHWNTLSLYPVVAHLRVKNFIPYSIIGVNMCIKSRSYVQLQELVCNCKKWLVSLGFLEGWPTKERERWEVRAYSGRVLRNVSKALDKRPLRVRIDGNLLGKFFAEQIRSAT